MQALMTRQATLASLAIRVRLLDSWSHSIGLEPGGAVLDSTALNDGVRRRSINKALHGATAVLLLDVPLPDEEAGLAWAQARLGTPYDWKAIGGFAFGEPERENPERIYCHEFIAGWWKAGGLTDFDGRRLVSAKHLIRVAARIGQVRELDRTISWA